MPIVKKTKANNLLDSKEKSNKKLAQQTWQELGQEIDIALEMQKHLSNRMAEKMSLEEQLKQRLKIFVTAFENIIDKYAILGKCINAKHEGGPAIEYLVESWDLLENHYIETGSVIKVRKLIDKLNLEVHGNIKYSDAKGNETISEYQARQRIKWFKKFLSDENFHKKMNI